MKRFQLHGRDDMPVKFKKRMNRELKAGKQHLLPAARNRNELGWIASPASGTFSATTPPAIKPAKSKRTRYWITSSQRTEARPVCLNDFSRPGVAILLFLSTLSAAGNFCRPVQNNLQEAAQKKTGSPDQCPGEMEFPFRPLRIRNLIARECSRLW